MPLPDIILIAGQSPEIDQVYKALSPERYHLYPRMPAGEKTVHEVPGLKPDLIIVDTAPCSGPDGIDTAAAITARFGVPIMYLLSSGASPLTLERAAATCPAGYAGLPVQPAALSAAISLALDRKRPEEKPAGRTLLLRSINRALCLYLDTVDKDDIFNSLLDILLEISGSESGFIDEVMEEPDGTVYKTNLALTDISWDKDSEKLYEALRNRRKQFRNLDNLSGLPAKTGEIVIANRAEQDTRAGGLPAGHPPVKTFMGIPVHFGGRLIGVAGIANRAEGYTAELAAFLEPFISTLGAVMHAARQQSDRLGQEKQLRQSEKKFRTLFEHAPFYIWRVNADGTIADANPAALNRLGYRIEEIIDKPFLTTLYAPACRGKAAEAFEQWKKTGAVRDIELTVLTKAGEERTVLLNASSVYDETSGRAQSVSFQHDITEYKQITSELEASRKNLHNLLMNQELIRENERKKISREIHDELGQCLTALKIDLYWLKGRLPGKNRDLTEKSSEMLTLLDTTIQSVKRIAAALRPGILDDLGLIPALEWQAREFEKHSRIPCRLALGPEEPPLSSDQATALFRIFQESLTNAARHAQATEVSVDLQYTAGILSLSIKDNGIGIPADKIFNSTSLGLSGMRERLIPFNGQAEITGKDGRGTTVQVTMPVPR